jgi:signal transduction histidine kinase
MTRIRLRSAISRYATAVAVVALAAVCTRWLRHVGDAGISPLFFAAVLISAWVGGLGPGLLATGLSGFATAYLLFPPDNSLIAAQDIVLRIMVFTIVALLASSLNAATRRAAEAMRKARDAAEDASAAKTRFLAMVSHELRTPLSSVLMVAEAMENDPSLSGGLRDDAATIRRSVELETRLIDDLVDLSRIASGKLHLDTLPLDLRDPLAEAIRFCQNDARERQLELTTEFHASNCNVEGDPVRLQQIFWNLIRNAIKFTPEGGRIAIRTLNAPSGHVVVEVSDTGIGIDPQRLSLIFQAFEQGGPDITARFGGLGLGLAIAQGLTRAHGGTIRAASDGPNRGSVFTVEFPILPKPAQSSPTQPRQPIAIPK